MSQEADGGSPHETSPDILWDEEYSRGGIPSSVREEASGSVVDFINFAASGGVTNGPAIDVGCGSGRNAIYLAEQGFDVVALDYARSQIEHLERLVKRLGLAEKVHPHLGDVREQWPVADGSIVCGIDAFCFKHQISPSDVQGYVQAASRAFRPGGLTMISFAGREDGYYSQFPLSDEVGVGQVICDPVNNIFSKLYDPEEVISLFKEFDVQQSLVKRKTNEMHGHSYQRETHILYLRRK